MPMRGAGGIYIRRVTAPSSHDMPHELSSHAKKINNNNK